MQGVGLPSCHHDASPLRHLFCLLQCEVKGKPFQWRNRQPWHHLSPVYNSGVPRCSPSRLWAGGAKHGEMFLGAGSAPSCEVVLAASTLFCSASSASDVMV